MSGAEIRQIKKEMAKLKASLGNLEGLLTAISRTTSCGSRPSADAGNRERRAVGLTKTMLDIIDQSERGVMSRDLIDKLRPFTKSPSVAVKRAIARQAGAKRIKRVNGRWVSIEKPGEPDIITRGRPRNPKPLKNAQESL